MITSADLLNFNVYKKEVHTGSDRGMRFQVGKEEKEIEEKDEEGNPVMKKETVLAVYVWPEPFSFEQTQNEKKERVEFPFSVEGQKEALNWLNETREQRNEYWEKYKGIMYPID